MKLSEGWMPQEIDGGKKAILSSPRNGSAAINFIYRNYEYGYVNKVKKQQDYIGREWRDRLIKDAIETLSV